MSNPKCFIIRRGSPVVKYPPPANSNTDTDTHPCPELPCGDCYTDSTLLGFNTFEFNKFLLNTT